MNTSKTDFFPKQGLEVNIPESIICSSYLEARTLRQCLLVSSRPQYISCCSPTSTFLVTFLLYGHSRGSHLLTIAVL